MCVSVVYLVKLKYDVYYKAFQQKFLAFTLMINSFNIQNENEKYLFAGIMSHVYIIRILRLFK